MAQTPQEKKSVQTFPSAIAGEGVGGGVFWLRFGEDRDEAPTYWSPQRDQWLREFVYWPGNDLLVGTISTVAAKVATTGFILEGPERTANFYRNKLVNQIDFGGGWTTFIMKWVWDYLSQDPGGWAEQIGQSARRTQDNRLGPRTGAAMGWSHLDVEQLRLTQDPQWPASWTPVYADKSNPSEQSILMHRSRLMQIVDSPTPYVRRRFVGFCAVSRSLATAQILLDITRYERERLSDLPPAGLLFVNNLTQNQWEDLEKRYEVRQQQQGNRTWRDIMVAFGISPELPVQADLLSFSNLPEHFDKRTATEIAIYSFALAFRIDPREIWPVSAGPMGTATEANIQHLKARAKGPGLIMTDIERVFNSGTTIAPSLTFKFDFQDAEEDLQAAAVANAKADFITKLTNSQILDIPMARSWLVKEGLFDEQDLLAFAEEEQATDVEAAKSFALDMGPRTRVFSDENKSPIRLEKRAQLWRGFTAKGGEGSGFFGHRGRPGEVGGSLPEGAEGAPADVEVPTQEWEPGTAPDKVDADKKAKANAILDDGLTEMLAELGDEFVPEQSWQQLDSETRELVKDDIISELSYRTGLDYDTVNAFIKQWATSAADDDLRSLELQIHAAEVFGVEPRASLLERRNVAIGSGGAEAWESNGVSVEHQRTFIREMYSYTQERLREAGYQTGDTIQLYRGTVLEPDTQLNDIVSPIGNPMQSWSAGRRGAIAFADSHGAGGGGSVLIMDVPVESIVSTARTGIGCLDEGEFVIMGSTAGNKARVDYLRPHR